MQIEGKLLAKLEFKEEISEKLDDKDEQIKDLAERKRLRQENLVAKPDVLPLISFEYNFDKYVQMLKYDKKK